MRLARRAFLAILLARGPSPAAADVTVFAAASLRDALEAATREWAAATGEHVVVSYAASSALARQIEHGAPADLFVSADADWVAYLDARGLVVPGSRRDLLANDLVLVAPSASRIRVELSPGLDLAAALGKGRLALADPRAVPAGKYARAALASLGAWKGVERRIAGAENVRAALALVARGEAPLGIVYGTDAAAEPRVRVVGTFPAGSHPPIVYAAVRLRRARDPAAGTLLAWLASPAAQPAFQRFGFRRP